ncbi:uncharacterized protein G2W53_015695 [Senna tora]|uniref:Uncharacterized protein n=1 Tax=Senna tora TaxID=362788 RepID=A0A834WW06_9FABA|nr:uncharacterized protein G2W53_015691 [Senna tora]KAF7833362.1 uncharacterized protein G2W53_015695 [Senna tora]
MVDLLGNCEVDEIEESEEVDEGKKRKP